MIELVRCPSLADAPYAYAAVSGDLCFTAGACPLDEHGRTVAAGDVAAQAEQAMANLVVALEAAGSSLRHVLKSTVLVATTSRADLTTVWTVVRRHFGGHDAPNTLVGVTVLGYPDQLVEVEAVAIRTDGPR